MGDKENLLVTELLEEIPFEVQQIEERKDEKSEVLHGGRPKNEEPHVKKIKKRTYEKIEYIVRVDLVQT